MKEDGSRWAVVTGVSKGIGRAVARRLAAEGFGIIGCARGQEALDALAAELAAEHPSVPVHLLRADLGKASEVKAFAMDVLRLTPHPDILVNNAGIFRPGGILDEQEGGLEELLQLNLYSAYHLTRALAPGMAARHRGHIFNLCSVASLQAYPGGASYAVTKFAMLGFSRSLRVELRDKGVKVTTLLPGATWTDSWSGSDLAPSRFMQAEDIAATIWSAYALGPSAVVEEILLRPQLGDL